MSAARPQTSAAPRIEFETALEANIVAIDGTWRHPCRVLDVSGEGAKLDIEMPCPLDRAREFFLLLSSVGVVYRRCELAWVNGSEVGVRFLIAAARKSPPGRAA